MPVLSNDKHESFAQQVAIGTPYTVAYIQAGFDSTSRDNACSNACRLLRDPEVKARVDELKVELGETLQQNFGISREWMLRMLERNVAQAYGVEPYAVVTEAVRNKDGSLKLDENGQEVVMPVRKFRYDPAAANKSLELMGKLMGEFQRLELTGAGGGPIRTKLDVEFVGPLANALTRAVPNA